MSNEWSPIETAPRDGTIIRVRNKQMEHPVLAKWGKFTSPITGRAYDAPQFVLVLDEGEKLMPISPGSLVIPTEWQPA